MKKMSKKYFNSLLEDYHYASVFYNGTDYKKTEEALKRFYLISKKSNSFNEAMGEVTDSFFTEDQLDRARYVMDNLIEMVLEQREYIDNLKERFTDDVLEKIKKFIDKNKKATT